MTGNYDVGGIHHPGWAEAQKSPDEYVYDPMRGEWVKKRVMKLIECEVCHARHAVQMADVGGVETWVCAYCGGTEEE